MPEDITYEAATITDLPKLIDLIKRSKFHFYPGKTKYVNDFVKIWGPNAYYVQDNFLIKTVQENTVAGLIGMRAPNQKKKFAELDLFFIDDQYIGKGLGRLMWEKVVAMAQQHSWPSIQLIANDLPYIVGFYQHMGAKIIDSITLPDGTFPIMEYTI